MTGSNQLIFVTKINFDIKKYMRNRLRIIEIDLIILRSKSSQKRSGKWGNKRLILVLFEPKEPLNGPAIYLLSKNYMLERSPTSTSFFFTKAIVERALETNRPTRER